MKKVFYLMMIATLLGAFSLRAQSTQGTEFWVTFGQNFDRTSVDSVDLQIRIVGGADPTSGTIHFTTLGTSIPFSIGAQQVFTYTLTPAQKTAVYNKIDNPTDGTFNNVVSSRSIHITTNDNKPVTVYALNQSLRSTDATNVLPVNALGTEYYFMSYRPDPRPSRLDAYAVVATEDTTRIFQNDTELVVLLRAGDVYYRTGAIDMTGIHINADKPFALFALHQGAQIPFGTGFVDCLMQQLAPVETWGMSFLVPVSHRERDIVRIVASQPNTTITQTGGTLLSGSLNLSPGQFAELRVDLANNGCSISADKPIGVCAYLTGTEYNADLFGDDAISDPAQTWLPPMEQTIKYGLIAPFIPNGDTELTNHYALVLTPTLTKGSTRVAIGGGTAVALSGGTWKDNATSGMSFYNMPLTDPNAAYHITNQAGLILLCYGVGTRESYYYVGAATMRNLNAGFYVNNIYYGILESTVLCTDNIAFRAEVESWDEDTPGSLKWFIDGLEYEPARDQLTWDREFPTGRYEIKMLVRFVDGDDKELIGILNVGAEVTTLSEPVEGGTTTGDGCYKVDPRSPTIITVSATANAEYDFVNWTENGVEVYPDPDYRFAVEGPHTLTANFTKKKYNVIVKANEDGYGTTTGSGAYEVNTVVEVEAFAKACYRFVNWTIDGVEVSTDNPYRFIVTDHVTIVANFDAFDFDTYVVTLWYNTFMLNLKQLALDGYDVIGCKWFKNGTEETNTRTVDQYSYSAGPRATDLLEAAPTYYTYQILTRNHGHLCSTRKLISPDDLPDVVVSGLWAYPNPVSSGSPFTIEGVAENSTVEVYNQYGVRVGSAVAKGNAVTLSLNLPAGVYFIRANGKEVKIVVI